MQSHYHHNHLPHFHHKHYGCHCPGQVTLIFIFVSLLSSFVFNRDYPSPKEIQSQSQRKQYFCDWRFATNQYQWSPGKTKMKRRTNQRKNDSFGNVTLLENVSYVEGGIGSEKLLINRDFFWGWKIEISENWIWDWSSTRKRGEIHCIDSESITLIS